MALASRKFPVVDPGHLNQRVEVQRFNGTRDRYGDETGSWSTVKNGVRWANVEYLTGREQLAAAQAESDRNARVTIRHFSTVQAKDRIFVRQSGRYLEIDAIRDPDMRKQYLVLECIDKGGQDESADD